jgi:hypothetical protein
MTLSGSRGGVCCGEDSERKWWRMLLCIKLDICASVGAAVSIAPQQMWIKKLLRRG